MKKIIKFLNEQNTRRSSLIIELSKIIEDNSKAENYLKAGKSARIFLKECIEKEYPNEFNTQFSELFEVEPSSLISTNYNSIFRNQNKSPSAIAIIFVEDFVENIPEYLNSMKMLREYA